VRNQTTSDVDDAVGTVGTMAERDLPRRPLEVPNWSESFFSQAYSPATGVGLYLRICRSVLDPELWYEVVLIYLPGNRFLVTKGHGYRQHERGPGANGLRFECDEPFERWTKRFKGAARLVSGDEIRGAALTDGPFVPVRLDVEYRSLAPVVGADLGEHFWASGHYEQHCAVHGYLTYGCERLEIDGTGMRDHSSGPRELTGMGNFVWTVAQFPESRRTVMYMHLLTRDGGLLTDAVIGRYGGEVRKASIADPPLIHRPDQADDAFEVTLVVEGEPEPTIIRGTPLQTAALGLIGTNEWTIGPHPAGHHIMFESQLRLDWNGEIGHGYMERGVAV
jgi:hypothetical protein